MNIWIIILIIIIIIIVIVVIVIIYRKNQVIKKEEKKDEKKEVYKLPAGIKNGEVVSGTGTDEVYKIENDKKRYYNMKAYLKDGSPIVKKYPKDDILSIPLGAPMPE